MDQLSNGISWLSNAFSSAPTDAASTVASAAPDFSGATSFLDSASSPAITGVPTDAASGALPAVGGAVSAAPIMSAASVAPALGNLSDTLSTDLTGANTAADPYAWLKTGGVPTDAASGNLPATPVSGGGGILDTLKGVTLKDLQPVAGLGALGYNMMNRASIPHAGDLLKSANQLSTQGQQLGSYLQSGTLPPGAQAQVNQGVQSAKAAIRSKYAQMGMTGSTAEMQELNSVDQNAAVQFYQIAQKLLETGLSETGMSNQVYEALMKAGQAQNASTQQAIMNFASSLGGGGTTIKIGA